VHRIPEALWRMLLQVVRAAYQQTPRQHAAGGAAGGAARPPEDEYIVDSMPVAVCANVRMSHCKLYQGKDFHGYVASRKTFFYGLRLHLVTTPSGQPVEFVLAPGSMADIRAFKTLELPLPPGATLYADKAYNDYALEQLLADAMDIQLLPLRKKNSYLLPPGYITYVCAKIRKQIESTFARLNQLMPKRIHAVTPRGFELKIGLFVLAYALCG
jgi:hypothetical protein